MAMAKNTLDYKHQVVFAIQDDNQEKPFVFNQITIGEASQTVSPQEHFGLGQIGIHSSSQAASFAGVSCLYKSSFFLQDKRKQIYLYLFPFHFFGNAFGFFRRLNEVQALTYSKIFTLKIITHGI